MSKTHKDRKKRNPLDGVRIPLPKQTGGLHRDKRVYKRRLRTQRQADEF